jgi:hypothetical protein
MESDSFIPLFALHTVLAPLLDLFDTGRPLEPREHADGCSEQAYRHRHTTKSVSIGVPRHPPLWSARKSE